MSVTLDKKTDNRFAAAERYFAELPTHIKSGVERDEFVAIHVHENLPLLKAYIVARARKNQRGALARIEGRNPVVTLAKDRGWVA